jgi:hypothetical protein
MSSTFCSYVEKMRRLITAEGAEEKLLCVVFKVQHPAMADPSLPGDDSYVVKRVNDSIRRRGFG